MMIVLHVTEVFLYGRGGGGGGGGGAPLSYFVKTMAADVPAPYIVGVSAAIFWNYMYFSLNVPVSAC